MTFDFFGQQEIDFLIDLGLCLLSGFIIGSERESRQKDAGISTHVLVIVGAMVFTFLSGVVDPASKSRIAAQVITGIGFLGAGLIIKDGVSVKNLTTAASLWASASIGMAYGFGYHLIGFLVTLVIVLTPRIPHISKRTARTPKNPDNNDRE
ncbi:MAG: MgtC/SapB family protein [Deltaproteobacteria bacterium]|jgi:putative Mg2+ transporter-C (MgtC) family protein|nr:MgtC/SapB family protein [Deltaproteobacteria bacterium]